MTEIQLTQHGSERLNERNISLEAVAFARQRGLKIRKQGVIFYFVRSKDIRHPEQERFRHLVLICSGDGQVITAYKNKDALKSIRKSKKSHKLNKKQRRQLYVR